MRVLGEDAAVLVVATAIGIWLGLLRNVTCPGGPRSLCIGVSTPLLGPWLSALISAAALFFGFLLAARLDRDSRPMNVAVTRWWFHEIMLRPDSE